MKDINLMYKTGLSIVRECCGDIVKPISKVSVNTRAESRWGQCKYRNGSYEIEISYRLLSDVVPMHAAMSTMVHEILHATDAHHHDSTWKRYARQVMRKHPELSITRTSSADKFNLPDTRRLPKYKYAIECCNCGMVHRSSRMSKSIKHPDWFSCGKCGGKFKRVM